MNSLDKRVDDIGELWVKCGGTLDELLAHREVTQWISNLTVHTTGRSLLDALGRGAVKTEHGSLYAYGQSSLVEEDEMLQCFKFSVFRIGWLARLVLLETGRPVDSLEAAYNHLNRAVDEWAPSQLTSPAVTSRSTTATSTYGRASASGTSSSARSNWSKSPTSAVSRLAASCTLSGPRSATAVAPLTT